MTKPFFDQACSVKITGYWPRLRLKGNLAKYPVILTSRLVSNAYLKGTMMKVKIVVTP